MKKKILLICTVRLEDNGIATFVTQSANILSQLGNDVTVLAINSVDSNKKDFLINSGVTLIENYDRSDIVKYFFNLLRLIRRKKFDIVHVHGNSNTMSIELLAAKMAGCKVRIAHSHNTTTKHMRAHNMLRLLFNMTVTDCLACGEEAGKWLFNKKQFFVINNGIDLNKYRFNEKVRFNIRKKYSLSEDSILLGNVGRFNDQKNQSFLLKVLSILDDKYKLMLVGSGKYEDKLKKQVKELGLDDRVIFTGKVNNVYAYLHAMDLFLLPSKYEGLPFTLVEAQAAGLSSIVSSTVSQEADITGMIDFESIANTNAWKNKILSFSTSRSNRMEKSAVGIQSLSSKGYSVEENVKYMNNKYNDFLVNKSRGKKNKEGQ